MCRILLLCQRPKYNSRAGGNTERPFLESFGRQKSSENAIFALIRAKSSVNGDCDRLNKGMVSSKPSLFSATDPRSFAKLARIPNDPFFLLVRQLKGARFAMVLAKIICEWL